jgi:cupin 2 domain-containing protein
MTIPSNLFDDLPSNLPDELVTTLLDASNVRIKRIVSNGHASPEGFWYDQDQHEWVMVLKGAARLRFEGKEPVEMREGDFINIPAHKKHRVEWTTPDEPTIWLAIYHPHNPTPLTKTEVVIGAVKSGIIGLALFVIGLAAIVSVGVFGTTGGTGIGFDPSTGARIWAVAIGVGCILLMLPSVLLLGIGIQHLRLSIVGGYSLIVGKPVYGFTVDVDFRPKAWLKKEDRITDEE